jgi:hypothetical protein
MENAAPSRESVYVLRRTGADVTGHRVHQQLSGEFRLYLEQPWNVSLGPSSDRKCPVPVSKTRASILIKGQKS